MYNIIKPFRHEILIAFTLSRFSLRLPLSFHYVKGDLLFGIKNLFNISFFFRFSIAAKKFSQEKGKKHKLPM